MRPKGKSTFVVLFGNRGFFPGEIIAQARKDMAEKLKSMGHKVLMLDESVTKHGAISDYADAEIAANFLKENEGKYQGVILSLPNFGDESSAINALKHIDLPILIQAFPDSMDKMAPEFRRDAFCGKFSVMDVFYQYGRKFTAMKPHVVWPDSESFTKNVEHFDRVCRVVHGFKDMVVGAIGARTTAFKTVRIDELGLQKNGITMEVVDLSEVFARVSEVKSDSGAYKDKSKRLKEYCSWEGAPKESFDKLTRLGVVLDELFEEWKMDAMALRCWIEMQTQLKVSPCVLLSEMNDRKIPISCEVDVGNAVAMHALNCASGESTAVLDWNNNYGDDANKCILFHCGSTAQSLMKARGQVVEHAILKNAPEIGPGCSYGPNQGRIAAFDFTFGSMSTRDGELDFYLGDGSFTEDKIPEEFFGCGGVAEIKNLQDVLLYVGKNGFRHHVSVTPGSELVAPLKEALEYYLGYNVAVPQ